MKMNIEEAIALARSNKSLQGVAIKDLQDVQVKAVDALILAEHGIVVPEQNIFYDDGDIAYDPDFDEVEWSQAPVELTWDEKAELARRLSGQAEEAEEISMQIKIQDVEVRKWIRDNQDKVGEILGRFVVDIYNATKLLQKQ
ncbi:hypothetical protein QWY85_11155 [Neolewinella lacunae]|uniref:Uncharacterized protein n=1 Tax=Neolewinella lacunae TaxID=1517758 RepID=A0A923TA99_9BACT|nr:hypothetical protein [Neolewinella lacunae]MBC6995938.1 hypothetical protein [Neolewinella lacunae]MDN3635218.1 hypothetical protein [Neolewinella lacunae]